MFSIFLYKNTDRGTINHRHVFIAHNISTETHVQVLHVMYEADSFLGEVDLHLINTSGESRKVT